MGFIDRLRESITGRTDEDYFDEEEYEDEPHGEGLLGNSYRAQAESVSVYTRSGRQLSGNDFVEAAPEEPAHVYTPSPELEAATAPSRPAAASAPTLAQLPPYVLKPVAYDDVETVVRRVRTKQPVVLVFRNTNIDIAKRILDFSYGFATGIDSRVEELGDRVFCVLPKGMVLSQADIDKLVAEGDLAR